MRQPVLQAMLLADHVYQDKATGKYIIAGVFTALTRVATQQAAEERSGSPAKDADSPQQKKRGLKELIRAGSPYVYINVIEVQGEVSLHFRYLDLHDNQVLFESSRIRLKCDNPLQPIDLSVPLPPLPTPHDGPFALELLCDDELIGICRVVVVSPEDEEKGPTK